MEPSLFRNVPEQGLDEWADVRPDHLFACAFSIGRRVAENACRPQAQTGKDRGRESMTGISRRLPAGCPGSWAPSSAVSFRLS
jgi:hypothetical protein